jgi:hypothetical protein
MSKLEDHRLDELKQLYPVDRCRQIATYVLENTSLPEADRLCAAGILGALDGAVHADYLTVIQVNSGMLMTAAFDEAERLWGRYGEEVPLEP